MLWKFRWQVLKARHPNLAYALIGFVQAPLVAGCMVVLSLALYACFGEGPR